MVCENNTETVNKVEAKFVDYFNSIIDHLSLDFNHEKLNYFQINVQHRFLIKKAIMNKQSIWIIGTQKNLLLDAKFSCTVSGCIWCLYGLLYAMYKLIVYSTLLFIDWKLPKENNYETRQLFIFNSHILSRFSGTSNKSHKL